MNGYEKMIMVMQREARKRAPAGIVLGEMLSASECRIGSLDIDAEDLLVAEHLTADLLSKADFYADEKGHVESGVRDKSRYMKGLKKGDRVLVYQLSGDKFVILEKVVSADVSV